MALAARTVSAIQQRLRPSAATEFVNACNNLSTTLTKDCRLQLQARMTRPAVLMLADLVAAGSKTTLQSSLGQDALLLKALAQWLNDIPASYDVLAQLATVT